MHEARRYRLTLAAAIAIAQVACFRVVPDEMGMPEPPVPPCVGAVSGPDMPTGSTQLPPLPTFQKRTGTVAYQPWTSGHALAVRGPMLLVADADNGALVFVDRASMQVVRTLPIGSRPEQVVVGPDGDAYVSVRGAGDVVHLTPTGPSTWEIAATWHVGTEPAGIALDPAGEVLHVVLVGDRKLLRLEAKTGATLLTTALGDAPFGVAVPDATHAYVTDRAGPVLLSRREGKDQLVQSRALVKSAWSSACDETATDGVFAARALAASVVPGSTQVQVAHVVVNPGSAPDSLAALQSGCATGDVQKAGVSHNAYGSGVNSQACNAPVRPVEVTATRITATASLPPFLESQTVRDLAGRPLAARFDQPRDIAHHPTLELAMIAAQGTDNLLVLDSSLGGPLPVGEVLVGKAPKAVAFSEDGLAAYVLNAQDFTVGEVDLSALANGPGAQLAQTRTVAYGADPLPETARLGRRTFTFAGNPHVSADAHFACATCHFEGLEDKQVWFIADGPRQTPALAGRLADTAPYNWKGTHDQLIDNMADTIGRMGGTGLDAKELESLQKFLLTGLPVPPNPNLKPEGLTPAQARGKELFDDGVVGCSGCHVPGSGTDGLMHDVGTATPTDLTIASLKAMLAGKPAETVVLPFNTPSLRMLARTAPYLHDGSAATLEDALKATGDTMGHTSQLTADQRADLIAYLLTL